MKILLCIPIIVNPVVAREAIEQIVDKQDVSIILCNNGGGEPIDAVLNEYRFDPNVIIWKKHKNVYVNPIWNEFLEYFLENDQYDRLIILNSDLTLQNDWDIVVKNRWESRPDEILVPTVTDDKLLMYKPVDSRFGEATEVTEGVPGIFITMNRRQAKAVYPINESCKVWYGDNWCYGILTGLGEKIMVLKNLLAFHHHSTSVQSVPGIHNIIEEDKLYWKDVASLKMQQRIQEIKDDLAK